MSLARPRLLAAAALLLCLPLVASADPVDDAAAVLVSADASSDSLAAACDTLGAAGGPKAEKALLAWVKAHAAFDYERMEVPAAAGTALGRIGTPTVEASLLATLAAVKGEPQAGWLIAAARGLGAIKSARAVKPLAAALKLDVLESDCYVAVAEALESIGDRSAADPIAAELKNVAGPGSTGGAQPLAYVHAVGALGSPAHAKLLVPSLRADNAELRAAALDALGKLGWTASTDEERLWAALARQEWDALAGLGQKALPPLLLALGEYDVGGNAAEALAAIGAPAVAPLVVASAAPAVTPAMRANLAQALADIGDPARKAVVAALSAKAYTTRAVAVAALGLMGDGDAAPLIVQFLAREASIDAAQTAAVALRSLDAAGTRLLYPLLSGKDPKARFWAAYAIRFDLGAEEDEVSRIGSSSKDADVQGACAWILVGMDSAPARADAVALLGTDPSKATRAQLDASKNPWFVMTAISMAEDTELPESYLDSGNERYEAAAEIWARDHGYMVTRW